MEIRLAEDQKRWDAWLVRQDKPAFTQSSAWAAILTAENKIVELLEFYEGSDKIAQALVLYNRLFNGWRYAFCPRGPVFFDRDDRMGENAIVQEAAVYAAFKAHCAKKSCLFVRIEPSFLSPQEKSKKVVDINPRATTYLDLHKKEDELLSAMHQKTRYNIRLAEKKDVVLHQGKDVEILYDLLTVTGERDRFKLHGKIHYEKIVASPLSSQLTVMLKEKPIATALFASCGNTFTYVYGASDYEHRSLMAPYFLQWSAIKLAQERGFRWYDFFGIAPVEIVVGEYRYDENHQYAGVTRFKLGFGGTISEAPGTYDLLISSARYRMYGLLRKIRRKF